MELKHFPFREKSRAEVNKTIGYHNITIRIGYRGRIYLLYLYSARSIMFTLYLMKGQGIQTSLEIHKFYRFP